MIKKLLFVWGIALMLCHNIVNAQVTDSSAQWTWMTGTSTNILFGVFGTKGVPDPANVPGRRFNEASWKDRAGNLWLFGGQGYGIASTSGDLNDLWKYDISTGLWTWVTGSTGVASAAVYGTQGVADAANTPGSRVAPAFWTDTAGNFWLFGGARTVSATDRYSDLWKFDPVAGMWTWMGGPTTSNVVGVYGTQGTAAATNWPGARGYSDPVAWVDSKNNFYIFGGSNPTGSFNDLWKYNPVTSQWTWLSGSNAYGQVGVYGTKGVAAATNVPGARGGAMGWIDANDKLYLYGGAIAAGRTNDMWTYDLTTNQWTWIGGTSDAATIANVVANYGTQNAPSATSWPGGRSGSWKGKDAQGNFWLFGGYGYASTTTANFNNDLWKYDPVTGQWTWVMGSKTVGVNGVYGTKGVQARTNYPGSRAQSGMWIDNSGNFWLHAGQGYYASGSNITTDLWKLSPPPCVVSVLNSKPLTFCDGDSVILKSSVINSGVTYQWFNGATAVGTDSQYVAKAAGSFKVQVTGTCNSTSGVVTTTINTLPTITISPTTAVICNGKDTALTGGGGTSYTWLPATYTGSGATVRANPTTTTTYTITGTDGNGCKNTTTRTVTVNSLPNITITPAAAAVCTGKDTALTANNGATYVWAPTPFTGSGATIRANPTTATTYTVTGTDANGCVNTATRQVTVNALPNISITPATAVICSGKDTALTGNGGATYTWLPNTYTGSGATIRANPTALTTYTVTGTDANGCVNTATRSVSVNTLPLVTITPATAVICTGKDTALTGGGGISYVWVPNTYTGSGATIRANPTSTTTYTVTGTDANGCSSTALRTVTVNTLPTVSITGVAPVCVNSTLSLTGTPSSGAWSSGTIANATINPTSGVVTGVAAGTSVITYTYTDANKCVGTDSKTVTVNALPAVPNPITGKTDLCIGDTTTLFSTTTGGAWSSGTTSVATIGSSTGKVTTVTVGTTLITYMVTNPTTNCSNSVSTNFNVRGLPAVPPAITGASHVCVGAMEQLSNSITGGTWSSGDVNVLTISPSTGEVTGVSSGTTSVKYTVNNTYSCKADITTTMTVYNNPVATITPAGIVGFCDGDSITLTTATVQGMSYQWLEGQVISGATGASYNAKSAGYYQVAIMDGNGCKDTSAIDTVVMYALPNPVITQTGQTLSAGAGYASYQWYANGVKVNGATQSTCIVTQSGQYYVVVTDSNGCTKASAVSTITVGIANVSSYGASDIVIYPNPAQETVNVKGDKVVRITLAGIDGKVFIDENNTKSININKLANALYIIRVYDNEGALLRTEKLVKAGW